MAEEFDVDAVVDSIRGGIGGKIRLRDAHDERFWDSPEHAAKLRRENGETMASDIDPAKLVAQQQASARRYEFCDNTPESPSFDVLNEARVRMGLPPR